MVPRPTLCACGEVRCAGQRYCKTCHAAYMRRWRKTHRLVGEARRKMNCRSYAGVYQRRGHLKSQPCIFCCEPAEKHHPDYSRPLLVIWMCRTHHLWFERTFC